MKNIVIVDIDGTVSKPTDRLKYLSQTPKNWDAFYEACDQDEPIKEICDLVYNLSFRGYDIVFCTGRRESTRGKTIKWLEKHVLPFGNFSINSEDLLMRPDGDKRHDIIVKPELIEKVGIKLEDIAFVLEDRDSMVKKWRELGVKCLQVEYGNF